MKLTAQSHHALLVIGTSYESAPGDGIEETVLKHARLGVADVRSLQTQVYQRSAEGSRRFVIVADTITVEAQNALLKLLEEPPVDTQFVLVIPNAERLLSTVRSRLQLFDDGQQPAVNTAIADQFCQVNMASRLLEIVDKTKAKDVAWMQELVSGLEIKAEREQNKDLLQSLVTYRQHETLTGASKKMLLEHIALSIN